MASDEARGEPLVLTEPAELLQMPRCCEQKLMRNAGCQKPTLQKTFGLQKKF